MNEPAKPRRLSLSDILEMVLARRSGSGSHVSLSRAASGETVIDVRVAVDPDTKAATIEAAEKQATELYDRLASSYPYGNEHEPATVTLSRNAKGETQIEVSLRTSSEGVQTLDGAVDAARLAYDAARMSYPMADGRTAKPGSVA